MRRRPRGEKLLRGAPITPLGEQLVDRTDGGSSPDLDEELRSVLANPQH